MSCGLHHWFLRYAYNRFYKFLKRSQFSHNLTTEQRDRLRECNLICNNLSLGNTREWLITVLQTKINAQLNSSGEKNKPGFQHPRLHRPTKKDFFSKRARNLYIFWSGIES